MMIDFGEAEVFEWEMPQARDGVVGRELALAHLLEKLADGFGVQEALSSRHRTRPSLALRGVRFRAGRETRLRSIFLHRKGGNVSWLRRQSAASFPAVQPRQPEHGGQRLYAHQYAAQ